MYILTPRPNNPSSPFRSKHELSFYSINIRSLHNKVHFLTTEIVLAKTDIIAVQETWRDDCISNSSFAIPGFSIIRSDRNRNGGAVALYISDRLGYSVPNLPRIEGVEYTYIDNHYWQ